MINHEHHRERQDDSCQSGCNADPKWSCIADDKVVPMPTRKVLGRVVKMQAGISPDRILIRDHNSPDDVIIADDQLVDLAEGNVFYSIASCELPPRQLCKAPAKLAYFVNDKSEIVIRPDQTGQSIRDLFGLPSNSNLVRDFEGGKDQNVPSTASASFKDGPVFITRVVEARLKIIVNKRPFTEADGVKEEMSGLQIAKLVYPEKPEATTVKMVKPEVKDISLTTTITVPNCSEYEVARKNVDGGYASDRIEIELGKLREGGLNVTLVSAPKPAVIYHGITSSARQGVVTDILVLVPDSYPGQMIDGAFLPEGSPLIGKLKGKPQEVRVAAEGRTWQLISYHPHGNGGAPEWNPTKHGFHTYYGELLSWLNA